MTRPRNNSDVLQPLNRSRPRQNQTERTTHASPHRPTIREQLSYNWERALQAMTTRYLTRYPTVSPSATHAPPIASQGRVIQRAETG